MSTSSFEKLILKGTSITEPQLRSLMQAQGRDGGLLEESLTNRTYSRPDEAMADLCRSLDLDFIKEIPANDIAADLVRDIPINFAKSHEVLPYKSDGDTVIVLVTNPLNHQV